MKKLLIATDSYFPKHDGVTVFLKNIVPRISPEFDITIIAPNFKNQEMKQIGRAKVIGLDISKRIKLADYPSIKLSRKNRKTIKKAVKEADIIWAQDPAPIGALSMIYGKKYKKAVLTYMHQIVWEHLAEVLSWPSILKSITSKIAEAFTKYLYNKCNLILVPYRDLAEELKEMGFISKKAIIKLGVDSKKFKSSGDKAQAKQAIGIDPKLRVIGYCGRLSKEKGLLTLRKAYARLKDEHKNIFLLLIGSGPEKEHFKNIQNAKITGFVKNVVPYLQATDIFVMPSITETTSLATIEAMSCEVPVIATKVGYIRDYVIEKFNGLLFPAQNEYLLRKKIELLLRDPRLRRLLGKNARKTIVQRFDWEKTVILINKALRMC